MCVCVYDRDRENKSNNTAVWKLRWRHTETVPTAVIGRILTPTCGLIIQQFDGQILTTTCGLIIQQFDTELA